MLEGLKSARGAKRLTQQQLADLMKVSVQTIVRWENGITTPSHADFETLSRCLNVEVPFLQLEQVPPDIMLFPGCAINPQTT